MDLSEGARVVHTSGTDDRIGTITKVGGDGTYEVAWHGEPGRVLDEHEADIRLATGEEASASKRLAGQAGSLPPTSKKRFGSALRPGTRAGDSERLRAVTHLAHGF